LDVYCNRNRKWPVDNNATDKPKVHDLAWKSRRHEIIESLIKPDYIMPFFFFFSDQSGSSGFLKTKYNFDDSLMIDLFSAAKISTNTPPFTNGLFGLFTNVH
jgi:hypothetical protein